MISLVAIYTYRLYLLVHHNKNAHYILWLSWARTCFSKTFNEKYAVSFSNITFLPILEEFWFALSFLFKKSGVKISSFSIVAPVVRLVGGPSSSIGRVEVFHFGEWGTVCDDRWTIKDGHVACRMLNFSKAVELFHGSTFGGGLGLPIWLTKLICNGTENSLFECKNAMKYLGITGCSHAQDAGVQCAEDGELINVDARAWA